jgi:hypothetical protein
MERLTEWNGEQTRHAYYPRCFEAPCYGSGCKIEDCPFETAVCDRLAAYEDTGLSPEKVSWMKEVVEAAFDNDTSRIERAHNLHVADKEGRCVVLPCKVGDKLYRVFAGEIFEHRVGSMKYFAIQGRWDIETCPFCPCVESSIGKTVFLTREEAEKALTEMEGKKDGNETSM